MTTLMVRGYVYRVNMSSEGNGVYNVSSYKMGSPEYEVSDNPRTKAMCVDEIGLNVVAKSRRELVRHISRLYKSLAEAVSFYNRLTNIVCYLESQTLGQMWPVFAGVSAFSFHELNDPYDNINGKVMQDITLSITREPWSDVPPQETPFSLSDNISRDITADRMLPISHAPTGDINQLITIDDPTRVIVIPNFYRMYTVDKLFAGVSSADQQPPTYSSPYVFGGITSSSSFEFIAGISGATGTTRAKFNGLVFDLSRAHNMTNTDLTVSYWNGSAWVAMADSAVMDYGDFARTGQSYIGWKDVGSAWVAQTLANGAVGFFVKITIATETGLSIGPIQQNGLVHAPSRPYIDVLTPPGGDLQAKLQLRLGSLEPWEYLDYGGQGGSDILDSKYLMNSLIIASERIDDYGNANNEVGMGFYSLGHDVIHDDPLQLPGGFGTYYTNPLSQNTVVTQGDLSFVSASTFYAIVSKLIMIRPGLYRVYLRYSVLSTSTPAGYIYLRATVTPTHTVTEYIETGHRAASRTFAVALDEPLVQDTECLADLGTMQIGSNIARNPGFQLQSGVRMFVEARKSTDGAGKILLHDIILFPVNESFSVLSGGRPPLARNSIRGSGSRDDLIDTYLPSLMDESLYVNSFEPGETMAYIGRNRIAGGAGIGGEGATTYTRSISEDYSRMGGGQFSTEPDYARRFWFLWYKRLPNGIVYSYSGFNSAIQLFSARQFVTLPADL